MSVWFSECLKPGAYKKPNHGGYTTDKLFEERLKERLSQLECNNVALTKEVYHLKEKVRGLEQSVKHNSESARLFIDLDTAGTDIRHLLDVCIMEIVNDKDVVLSKLHSLCGESFFTKMRDHAKVREYSEYQHDRNLYDTKKRFEYGGIEFILDRGVKDNEGMVFADNKRSRVTLYCK